MENNYQDYFDRLSSERKMSEQMTELIRQEYDSEHTPVPNISLQEPLAQYTLALREKAAEVSASLQQRHKGNTMYSKTTNDEFHANMKSSEAFVNDCDDRNKKGAYNKKMGLDYKA